MALDFPSPPYDGQIYVDPTSGSKYIYEAATTKWKSIQHVGVAIAYGFDKANASYTTANAAFDTTNAAFGIANNAVANTSNITISRNLSVPGNIAVGGAVSNATVSIVASGAYPGLLALSGWDTSAIVGRSIGAVGGAFFSSNFNAIRGEADGSGYGVYASSRSSYGAYVTSLTGDPLWVGKTAGDDYLSVTSNGSVYVRSATLSVNTVNILSTLLTSYTVANTSYASINSNWTVTNTVYTVANSSYGFSNSAYASINSNWTVMNALYSVANAAYANSNTKVTTGKSIAMAIVFS